MRKQKKIVNNLLLAVNASAKTQKNANSLVGQLIAHDPYKLTEFEVSFKIKNNKIENEFRILNFDCNIYSAVNPYLYSKRLELFKEIINSRLKSEATDKVCNSLNLIANTPIDLYFGFDIKENRYLFAFWLILGGLQSNGLIRIHKNSNRMVKLLTESYGIKAKLPKEKILNIGFDITARGSFFKIYYLYRKGMAMDSLFSRIIRDTRHLLSGYKYFTFISEKYDSNNHKVFKKVYFEFLQEMAPCNAGLPEALNAILEIAGSRFNRDKLLSIINIIGGRISIIAFGSDSSVTLYIRPC